MHFKEGHIFHIYNQGNNRQLIFFGRENYFFFLDKIGEHVFPFGDIFAYCLMPNHFHIMMQVNSVVLDGETLVEGATAFTRSATQSRTSSKGSRERRNPKITNLNKEIGIMLASYTRAINKQNGWSGSLFRQKTKAECLTEISDITPSFYNTDSGTRIHLPNPKSNYPQNCFDYIHNNPVKAGLVRKPEDWEFSSYLNYYENTENSLINQYAARNAGLRY